MIERNGAGAESTSVHDPRFGIVEVYATLFRPWDLLLRLGWSDEGSWLASVRKLRHAI